jgi:hypothetical protein
MYALVLPFSCFQTLANEFQSALLKSTAFRNSNASPSANKAFSLVSSAPRSWPAHATRTQILQTMTPNSERTTSPSSSAADIPSSAAEQCKWKWRLAESYSSICSSRYRTTWTTWALRLPATRKTHRCCLRVSARLQWGQWAASFPFAVHVAHYDWFLLISLRVTFVPPTHLIFWEKKKSLSPSLYWDSDSAPLLRYPSCRYFLLSSIWE